MSSLEKDPLVQTHRENRKPVLNSLLFGGLFIIFLLSLLSILKPTTEPRTHKETILRGVTSLLSQAQVELKQGRLQGKFMRARDGREFLGFLGVPYAKPPIDHLRFMPPEDPEPWEGIRDATQNSPQCPSLDTSVNPPLLKGTEDCLNLNIFSSNVKYSDPDRPLFPVMLYIHGGGHGYGTGQRYAPQYFMEENVVLINLDYRTGPLGTLSLNIREASGNQGLKDQVKALEWIRQNIRQFGGDSEKVTLFGNSGGGFQVSAHMISSLSKGLFQRVILQSGTILYPGVLSTAPEKDALDLALLSNCSVTSPLEILSCLKRKPVDTLIANALSLPNPLSFTFSVDSGSIRNDSFLSDLPLELLAKSEFSLEPMPLMIGVTSGEGLFESLKMFTNPTASDGLNLTETLVHDLHLDLSASDPEELASEVSHFYLPNGFQGLDGDTFWNVTNLFSDRTYVHPAHVIAQKQLERNLAGITPEGGAGKSAKHGVYLYYFTHPVGASHEDDLKVLVDYEGVEETPAHGDELQFFFPLDYRFPPITPQHQYSNFSRYLVKIWTAFADTGIPGASAWEPLEASPFKAFELSENPKMIDFLPERMNFWDKFNLTQLYR